MEVSTCTKTSGVKISQNPFYLLCNKSLSSPTCVFLLQNKKLGLREDVDSIDITNAEEYVRALSPIFQNKAARWKFAGEEILGKEGKQNWTKAGLAGYGFIETLTTNPSKLKFDENNKFDMKRLPAADSEIPASNGTATAAVSSNSDDPWS